MVGNKFSVAWHPAPPPCEVIKFCGLASVEAVGLPNRIRTGSIPSVRSNSRAHQPSCESAETGPIVKG